MYVRRDPSITAWRPVPGYPHYMVSDTGVIVSGAAQRQGRYNARLTNMPRPNGYIRVKLCRDGTHASVPLHRAVAWAFLGPAPEGKPFVNHLNGVRDDNRAENLQWVSHYENCQHAKNVLRSTAKGEKNPGALLTAADVPAIRARLARKESYASIGRDYGVTYQAISNLARGKTWGGGP